MSKRKSGYVIALPRGRDKRNKKLFLVKDAADFTDTEFAEWIHYVYPLSDFENLQSSDLSDVPSRCRLIDLIGASSSQNILTIPKK
jgi:hypothetical protein